MLKIPKKKVEAEFKRTLNFTDHDLEIFADILEWEEQNKKYPVFHHGANADINNLWKSFTHFRELLSLSPLLGQKIAMRGTDIYFRDVKTMEDILQLCGEHDYENGKANIVLCANYVLTAGLKTTYSTSSSIEYFLNNHSVDAPDIEEKFEEATALAGILADYRPFHSLFLQFLAHKSTFENSVLVGISAPPHLLPKNTAIEPRSSSIYTKTATSNRRTTSTTLDVFKEIQGEYEAHKVTPEPFKEEKRDLIPEARVSLHPDFTLHNEDVHMKAFDRFPLSDSEQKEFENEMRTATIGTLADWLLSHFKVMPDSFIQYPSLKRLYNYAYKATTGKEVEEKFAAESFFHLISNGHVNGVKEFIKTFPDIVNHKDFKPLPLAYRTLRTNKHEMLKFLCENFGENIKEALFKSPKGFYKAIRTCLAHDAGQCLDYLLSQYDVASIPDNIVRIWSSSVDDDSEEELVGKFLKYFPKYAPKVLRSYLKKSSMEGQLEKLIACGIDPQGLVEVLLAFKQECATSGENFFLFPFFSLLAKHKVDLSNIKTLSFKDDWPSDENINNLINNGINPQIIAEALLAEKHRRVSLGQSFSLYSFFNLITKHKVDLTNVKDLSSFFKDEYVSDDHINNLIACGITPQAIADALLAEKERKVSLGESFYLHSFFNIIVNHQVQLGHITNLKNWGWYDISVNIDKLIDKGIGAQLIGETLLTDYQDRVSMGETPFDLSYFFGMLDKHKVDLSRFNFKNLPSILESYNSIRDIDRLIASGITPQVLAEALLVAKKNAVDKGSQAFTLYSFYYLIQKYKGSINLKEVTDLKSHFHYEYFKPFVDTIKENLIACGIKSEVIEEGITAAEQNIRLPSKVASSQQSDTLDPNDIQWINKVSDELKNKQLDANGLEKQLDSLINPKALRKILGLILQLNDHTLSLKVLNLAYPDKDEFIALKSTSLDLHNTQLSPPLIYAITNAVNPSAILEYVGDRFPKLAIAMGSEDRKRFLQGLTNDIARDLIGTYPEVFTQDDEKNSFLVLSLECLPSEIRNEFVLQHKDKLKNIPPQTLKNNLGTILKINDYDLTLEILKRAYPNVEEFIALKSFPEHSISFSISFVSISPVQWCISQFPKAFSAMLDYMGDRFKDFALAQEENNFGSVLEGLSSKEAQQLIHKYPEIFTYVDEKKDFFDVALANLPFKVRKKFALTHIDKLKKVSNETGIPYFFTLLFSTERGPEQSLSFVSELLEKDPSLLDLESTDGLTIENVIDDVYGYKVPFKKLIKKIKR